MYNSPSCFADSHGSFFQFRFAVLSASMDEVADST